MHFSLPVVSVRLHLRTPQRDPLPPFLGSAVRGSFGYVFRALTCATGAPCCSGCGRSDRCPYAYVFETPRPEGCTGSVQGEHVPHPFVFSDLPSEVRPDEPLAVGLTLVGNGIPWFPHFIAAFHEMGRRGLRPGRHRFELLDVTTRGDGSKIFDGTTRSLVASPPVELLTLPASDAAHGPEALTVEFVAPTRLVSQGRLVERIEFSGLARAVLRRVSSLGRFHAHGEPAVDYRGLAVQAEAVRTVSSNLRWIDQTRYSCRQNRSMVLGGVVGTVRFEGPVGPFVPWLAMAERVHVGKGTSFGMGQMRVSPEEGA